MNTVAQALVVDHDPVERAISAPIGAGVTPMAMLDRALASGASLEMVEKLMSLQDRWEASQAKKAFTEAFAAFKSEAITVVRTRKVNDGPLKGRSYAELFSFVDAVTPLLSKHGLSASWAITKDEKDWIEVTCTVEHLLGHSKQVSMGGPPDTGGAKNPIQARASTVTYLERYTLKAATGIAEQGDDADGQVAKAPSGPISKEQHDRLQALLETSGADKAIFAEKWNIERLDDLPASKFAEAFSSVERWHKQQAAR